MKSNFNINLTLLTLGVLIITMAGATASGHEKVQHLNHGDKATAVSPEVLAKINLFYESSIKPIFKNSCFDCHSSTTRYPWYSEIPGAKQVIQNDIAEAKGHLDMSDGLPFIGHGTLKEDVAAIRKSIEDESMPPFRYRILHGSSRLSDEQKQTVFNWVDLSTALLK